ncbi:unnamed protein product [Plutella xylostella]|uniref:(diamondback moth) hypothetical protein n=1 Tax=Plutella xylostella TaxID=51655 RepID=A0A8S4E4C0_PLUXY|nr:unnamed protein product [Plutella xylostella]
MSWQHQDSVLGPLEKTISAKRHTLQDLKPLLEDRGGDPLKKCRIRTVLKTDHSENSRISNNSFNGLESKVSFRIGSRWCCRGVRQWFLAFLVMVAALDSTRICAEARSSEEALLKKVIKVRQQIAKIRILTSAKNVSPGKSLKLADKYSNPYLSLSFYIAEHPTPEPSPHGTGLMNSSNFSTHQLVDFSVQIFTNN